MNNKLKKWEISLLAALCAALLSGLWANGEQTQLSQKLIRLHVVAVSDDETEQEIKLCVRDGVLDYLAPLLENAADTQSAGEIIENNLSGIRQAALRHACGREVSVTLENENFPTRHYDSFSLPAGEYRSLRIVLGEGKGQNWGCVVFPPLCVEAAVDDAQYASVLSDDDIGLITAENGGYEIKFRLLELWGELRSLFSE